MAQHFSSPDKNTDHYPVRTIGSRSFHYVPTLRMYYAFGYYRNINVETTGNVLKHSLI